MKWSIPFEIFYLASLSTLLSPRRFSRCGDSRLDSWHFTIKDTGLLNYLMLHQKTSHAVYDIQHLVRINIGKNAAALKVCEHEDLKPWNKNCEEADKWLHAMQKWLYATGKLRALLHFYFLFVNSSCMRHFVFAHEPGKKNLNNYGLVRNAYFDWEIC